MRILLSDGSGLTSREVATQLAGMGHRVEVLTADPLALTRFTRHVRRLHRVPRYGDDPLGWLDAALCVLDAPAAAGPVDVLFPTQEQAAVLSLREDEIRRRGVAVAVPAFTALARVQDKVSATQTLAEIGVPQPPTIVVRDRRQLRACRNLPAYVKSAIGTASTGVVRVENANHISELADTLTDDAFALGGLVVQQAVAGPLAMVAAVFDAGRLVAWHATVRVREGTGGGASSKLSVDLPEVRAHCERLGAALAWHGALSLDVILPDGVKADAVVIDVNARLVEPMNAWLAGTDLVGALLDVSLGRQPACQPVGQQGVRTHQLLLAVLYAASSRRRAMLTELANALRRAGPYAGSREEVTPLAGDWRTALPVAIATIAGIVGPRAARALAGGAIANYALTSRGWLQLLEWRGGPGGASRCSPSRTS